MKETSFVCEANCEHTQCSDNAGRNNASGTFLNSLSAQLSGVALFSREKLRRKDDSKKTSG